MLLCCGCGQSANVSSDAEAAETAVTAVSKTESGAIPLSDEAQERLSSEIKQNRYRMIRAVQNDSVFAYTETVEGAVLTGTYRIVGEDLAENADMLCAAVGSLPYYAAVSAFDEIDTVEMCFLDSGGAPIVRQTYLRENGFRAAEDYIWENADYEALCAEQLEDLRS